MIRKATKSDAKVLAPMIMIILEDMELEVFQQLSKEQIEDVLIAGIQTENYRYSYRHAHVCVRENEVAGVLVGYSGSKEDEIDTPLTAILAEKGLDPSIKIFNEKETFAGEWYLDSIVTAEKYRGCGVGTELLEALDDFAKEDQETMIGLNCDQENPGAQRLYERMGFEKSGEMIIGGHCYNHMQKKV
ncbi:GNAT family N-acetyltransferase [Carnobacterium gallinarum]|uniref:GNAT family N-acetyltransferase n=1 Tax=Carnobacterium gallinarum TaxID=2749 RepID=UPI00054FC6C1|nr:GNAT family N-acetyltransferase [Carnobacterium gallinarum]